MTEKLIFSLTVGHGSRGRLKALKNYCFANDIEVDVKNNGYGLFENDYIVKVNAPSESALNNFRHYFARLEE